MTRLLVLVSLVATSTTAATPIPTDSERAAFERQFGTPIDGVGWAKFERDGNRFHIRLEGNHQVDRFDEKYDTAVERMITGDFTLTVQLSARLDLPAPKQVRNGPMNSVSGPEILVLLAIIFNERFEEDRAVKVKRIYKPLNDNPDDGWTNWVSAYSVNPEVTYAIPKCDRLFHTNKPLHVKIARHKMTYTVSLSDDGKEWTTLAPFEECSPETVRLSMGAWHDLSESSVVTYENLVIETAKPQPQGDDGK